MITSTHEGIQQPYHIFDGGGGLFLADAIDVVLDPVVGLDEDRHQSDTDADMNLDRGNNLEQFCGRELLEHRDVDGSTDVSQDSSLRMMLATSDGGVVVACPRNELVHPSEDWEGKECREEK